MDFNPDHMKEPEYSDDYFRYGVHKVQILGFEAGQTDKKTDYIKVVVVDPENDACEDSAMVFFTDKSSMFSVNALRTIALHNSPDDKHDAVKAAILKCKNHFELADLMNAKMIGKECWFTKYLDPERTYTGKDGKVRQSVNKSVMGYEPKLKEELMPKAGKKMTEADVTETFGPSEDVPFKDGGSKASDWA